MIATFVFLIALNSSTVQWENDNFGIGRKSDRFYTNGARVSVTLDEPPELARDFRAWFCNRGWCGDQQHVESVNVMIGQNFYTPEIITIAAPQPADRPWAGHLYAAVAESITRADERLQHTFELHLGVLGQGAGAQATQKFVHNDLGFSRNDPQGWRNQLENEPTIGVLYRQSRRWGGESLDVVPEFGAMLGTFQTFANAGGVVRLGHHISGFPAGVILPAATTVAPRAGFEAYVFAGGEARWIPYNATLDGGFFRDGPSANDPKRVVTDLRAGLSVRYKWVRLTYSVIDRSAEFEVPAGHLGSQRFGSFAFTIEPFDSFR